jgi:DUF1009 family protein
VSFYTPSASQASVFSLLRPYVTSLDNWELDVHTLEPFALSSNPSPLARRTIGLVAGEGDLPIIAAKNAVQEGHTVIGFSLDSRTYSQLQNVCQRVYPISAGLLGQTFALLQQEGVQDLVFAGKVNKWILFRNPRLDKLAIEALQQLRASSPLSDDQMMATLCRMLEGIGIQVIPQSRFLKELLLPAGVLTQEHPTENELQDIAYGFKLAKTIGEIDVGQSVVVKDGMALALEAIEGTDACIRRAGTWGRRSLWWFRRRHPGGCVVKVAKPQQDNRFDIPTVGLRTMKTLHKAGFRVLAVEASQTLFLEPEAMIAFANQHRLVIATTQAPLRDDL